MDMCTIICKYFPNIGWVSVKNRDRSYIPEISFKQSLDNGMETLLFWDDFSKYCEGMNHTGICIMSSSLMGLDDETTSLRRKTISKHGMKVKKALSLSNVKEAAMCLVEQKLSSNTLIFDKNVCYLLEGDWEPGGYKNQTYAYVIREIPQNETIVRTNHGIWLNWAGYQKSSTDRKQNASRISSESRKIIGEHIANKAKSPDELIDDLTGTYVDNPQLNCLRTVSNNKTARTTSQMMMIPTENTMFVRPIQSRVVFDFWKMNNPDQQLWIELLSNRILHARKEEIGSISSLKTDNNSS
jgi:hypothetical protein